MICWKTMGNFLSQWYQVKRWQNICTETLKNVFSTAKKWFQERSSGTYSMRIFFMFILLISNHTVFYRSIWNQFALVSFSKSWNCTRRNGLCNFSFLKNSLVLINSKLNSKPYDYLCKPHCWEPIRLLGLISKWM